MTKVNREPKKVQGRYTLNAISSYHHKERPIPFIWGELLKENNLQIPNLDKVTKEFQGKVKVPLSLIDALTTIYPDEKALAVALSDECKKQGLDIPTFNQLKISYQSKGTNHVDIAYSDNEDIRDLAINHFGQSELPIDDKQLDDLVDKLVKIIHSDVLFLRYLKNNQYIERFQNILIEYSRLTRDRIRNYPETKKKLKEKLKYYKVVRGQFIAINHYLSNRQELTELMEFEKANKSSSTRATSEPEKPRGRPTIEELKEKQEEYKIAQKAQRRLNRLSVKRTPPTKTKVMDGQMQLGLFEPTYVRPYTSNNQRAIH